MEPSPLPIPFAAQQVARCAVRTIRMLSRRQVHLPREQVGRVIRFGDGSAARVYRETRVDGAPETNRCVLVVCFRLRAIRGRGHKAFEVESLYNTPLFVGFPGFVSKLWLAHDERGVYRGLYEWDDPVLADRYARSLWRVLALVSVRGSIHFVVLPGIDRGALLAAEPVSGQPGDHSAWWRVAAVTPAVR